MPNQHTPEPWKVYDDGKIPGIDSGDDALSIAIFHDDDNDDIGIQGSTIDEARANVHRIVACVNALSGIGDPAETLKAVREALEFALRASDPDEDWDEIAGKIQDALALLPATTEVRP